MTNAIGPFSAELVPCNFSELFLSEIRDDVTRKARKYYPYLILSVL